MPGIESDACAICLIEPIDEWVEKFDPWDMHKLSRPSIIELTAAHVRQGLQEGRWDECLPGVRKLASDLDVSHDTVRAALKLLEAEGLLSAPCGAGQGRRLTARGKKSSSAVRRSLRVGLLQPHRRGAGSAVSRELLLELLISIEHSGHECFIASQSSEELADDPRRLSRLVRESPADAWVAYAASQKMLEWFVKKQIPVIAIGGHSQNVPVACTRSDNSQALLEVMQLLVRLNHRRIVLICPRFWREPDLHPAARVFIEAMSAHQLHASSYNLPEWEETPEGIQVLLKSLFQATPPTALLVFEPAVAVAALLFLSQRGLSVPKDVSLVCLSFDPVFHQLKPAISHVEWDGEPHIRRVTRWVSDLAKGTADRETKTIHAIFVRGGTVSEARRA